MGQVKKAYMALTMDDMGDLSADIPIGELQEAYEENEASKLPVMTLIKELNQRGYIIIDQKDGKYEKV